MKKLAVGVILVVIAVMFLIGFYFGKKDNTRDVINPLLQTTASKVISRLQGYPPSIDSIIDCTDKNNCKSEAIYPPYQWLRYAQYYYAKAFNQTIPTEEILKDLFLYTDNSYDQRLYQYGDIITDSGITDTQYKDKYLELFDNSIHPSYFGLLEKYTYYSAANPISEERLVGSQIKKDHNNGMLSMFDSTSAINASDAYLLSKDPKYLNAINNLLNEISVIYYFDGVASTQMENPPKYSTCYSLLATTKAFSATQDQQYLQLTKEIILGKNNYLQQLYSLNPDQIDLFSTNPMNILPCLDALNLLEKYDKPNNSIYVSTYNTIIDFLIKNNIIDSSTKSDSFGVMLIENKIDTNSTAWLIKILSENIIINGN